MTGSSRQSLPDDARVFRVLKKIQMFFEATEYRLPTRKAFEPTEEDLASDPVGVSVFDAARTTFRQGVAVREHMSGQPMGEVVQVEIGVARVREVGVSTQQPLDVIADPIPDLALAGADGHALILGLERKPGEHKAAWRNRLAALAKEAVAV